jgi:hypothetical protein
MPHPEHATEALTGPSDDGLGQFYSALVLVLAAEGPAFPDQRACSRRTRRADSGGGCSVCGRV